MHSILNLFSIGFLSDDSCTLNYYYLSLDPAARRERGDEVATGVAAILRRDVT